MGHALHKTDDRGLLTVTSDMVLPRSTTLKLRRAGFWAKLVARDDKVLFLQWAAHKKLAAYIDLTAPSGPHPPHYLSSRVSERM